MAFVSRLSDYVAAGVVMQDILEGKLVTVSISGGRDASNLPNVNLAASGITYGIFVAMAAPDNFPRPVNSLNYTANYLAVMRADINTGWGNPVDSYTYYREGLSSLEAPVLTSGMLVQLHRGGTYTLTSGCWIDASGIKVNGALVKVADDDTGRFALTTDVTKAVGFVEEYDVKRNYLVVTVKQ